MILSDARTLAVKLMKEHGLRIGYWHFKFDRAVKRFGCTHFTRFGPGVEPQNIQGYISLSMKMVELNSEEEVKQTILHEIAHALAGPGVGHGYKWKSYCRQLGIQPLRAYDTISRNVVVPKTQWTGTCPKGHSHARVKKPRAGHTGSCGICSPSFNREYLITWEKTVDN